MVGWKLVGEIFTQNACNMNLILTMFVVGNGTLCWQELE